MKKTFASRLNLFDFLGILGFTSVVCCVAYTIIFKKNMIDDVNTATYIIVAGLISSVMFLLSFLVSLLKIK